MSAVENVQNSFLSNPIRTSLTRPSDTTTYSTGDVISDTTGNAHFTFGVTTGTYSLSGRDAMSRSEYMTGTINSVILNSSANQSSLRPDLELWLFHTDIAAVADNSAFAPTDAEMLTLVGIIDLPMTSWKQGNSGSGATGNACITVRNIDLRYRCREGGLLYGQLVVRNAYVPVAGEVFTCDLMRTID